MSANSSLASALLNSIGFFHHFQFVVRCSSTVSWIIAVHKAEAREELADIWHFLIQASLELGLTPDDILKEYQRKNEINRQRQKDGY